MASRNRLLCLEKSAIPQTVAGDRGCERRCCIVTISYTSDFEIAIVIAADDGGRSGLRETLREAAAGLRTAAGLARRLAGKTLGAPLAHLSVMRPRAEHLQPAVRGGDSALPVEVNGWRNLHSSSSLSPAARRLRRRLRAARRGALLS